jgi:UDP-N-acetylmuramoylalanine--D-glutamate ligase
MHNTAYFRNKKICIVGLARSGLAAANLLFDFGVEVRVTDSQDNAALRANAEKLRSKEIMVELGSHSQEFIQGSDMLIVSPGVTNSSLPIAWAQEINIPVIGEIELGAILCPATIIAVTGSSGKTTVTTLIGKVIEASGRKAFVCGNIGNPFCGEVAKMSDKDYACLEVSSFQLERIKSFKPKIAVMLNFSRNHLDRHKDMREYLGAKKRIFLNQDKKDFLVLNGNDPILSGLAEEANSQVTYFYEGNGLNPNQAAVITVAAILGIERDICLKVFKEFKGLEHRFEYVAEVNGVRFINDSKATVAESTIWAIKNLPSGIILIAGGRDKGVNYAAILDAAKKKVRAIILIGEARKKIAEAVAGTLAVEEAASLKEAVIKAFEKASSGDSVLLSPMCSSFDMFSDYEERGRAFKEIVLDLAKNKESVNR